MDPVNAKTEKLTARAQRIATLWRGSLSALQQI
jgi:hypothetical protein